MSSGQIIFLEVTLVLGIGIALALWELLQLRRERRKLDREPISKQPGGGPSSGSGRAGRSGGHGHAR